MPDTAAATKDLTPTPEQLEGTYFGISVCHIGDDGEILMALGAHGKRRTLAAFNRHARVFLGLVNLADDPSVKLTGWLEDMKETRAVFRAPDAELGEDTGMRWIADWSDPDAPGAVPITILEQI